MIKIGFETSNICAPYPTGITNFTVGLIDALLASDEFSSSYEPLMLYRLSRFGKRKYRYRPADLKCRWYTDRLIPLRKDFQLIHCLGTNLVTWNRTKIIGTIHDLAIFKKEHQYELYSPRTYRNKRYRELTAIAGRADAVVTVSNSTKRDFLEMFNYPQENIHVIYEGIHDRFLHFKNDPVIYEEIKRRFGLNRKYLLFVGAVSVRKNIINLIKAFRQSGSHRDYDLVLVGPPTNGCAEIRNTIEQTKMEKFIIQTGYIDDDDLFPPLYANAAAFLFPTYYEGFGIPILEAMACGTPVLIGNFGAAPEIAGGHAVDCNPHDIDSIADGIRKVTADQAVNLEEARDHARSFTWTACADKVIGVYNRLLN